MTDVIYNVFSLIIIRTDVRSAPETNSAINDVINDEHMTSDEAWSRELRPSDIRTQSSYSADKFWEAALWQKRTTIHFTVIIFKFYVRPEFFYWSPTDTSADHCQYSVIHIIIIIIFDQTECN